MKTIAELREMSIEELNNEVLTLRQEQLSLRMKKANGNLDKTHLFKNVRKTIARAKTLMREKAGSSDVK